MDREIARCDFRVQLELRSQSLFAHVFAELLYGATPLARQLEGETDAVRNVEVGLLAGLLNGSVVIEVVFAWPGVGRLLLEGIQRRDFPVVEAVVLAAGFLYIVSALVVDILYAYINPRIRYG